MTAIRWKEPILRPSGYAYGEAISCIQKAVRRGDEWTSAWVAVELVQNGFDAAVWRRLAVIAVEDCYQDHAALVYINAAREAWISMRRVESRRPIMPPQNILVAAILRLCRYGSTASEGLRRDPDDLLCLIDLRRKEGASYPLPRYCRDGHTTAGKKWLRERAAVLGVDWHDALFPRQFYELSARTCRPAKDRKLPDWGKALVEHLNAHYAAGINLALYQKPVEDDSEEERLALEADLLPPEGYTVPVEKPEGTLFEGKEEAHDPA